MAASTAPAKLTTISDLLNCVASSCLTHRIPHALRDCSDYDDDDEIQQQDDDYDDEANHINKLNLKADDNDDEDDEERLKIWEEQPSKQLRDMEAFIHQVFDAYGAVKKAYATLQAAHNPWDPNKMRLADASVVAELRNLGRLRDRFRRAGAAGVGSSTPVAVVSSGGSLRDAVAPYEAALDEVKRELKAKEAEVQCLKEKLQSVAGFGGSGRRGRHSSSKRVGCVTVLGTPGMATPELFESYMEQVKTASKSFTAELLSLMRAARWDITAAVKSIVSGGSSDISVQSPSPLSALDIDPRHSKYALESYVNRKLFHGFENETFYIQGSLSSLLNPAEFRRDCFNQFRDMRAMDPTELLGILPGCNFGRFAANKYLAVMHAKMEESLFGSLEQRRQVMAGGHPRTGFYGEFLQFAKAVWLLHLLAFALEPAPGHFEASRGAEFHPQYMESVVRFGSGRVPGGLVVGFSVGPGFRLGNGGVVKARVYLVPKFQAT